MKPPRDSELPQFVRAADLAYLFGVGRSTMTRLRKDGLPKVAQGKYELKKCVDFFIEYRSGIKAYGEKRAEKSTDIRAARARVDLARAEKLEMENKVRIGELVVMTDAQAVFDAIATIIANAFESLGARTCNQVAGMDDPAEIQDLLWRESREVRNLIADRFEKITEGG